MRARGVETAQALLTSCTEENRAREIKGQFPQNGLASVREDPTQGQRTNID